MDIFDVLHEIHIFSVLAKIPWCFVWETPLRKSKTKKETTEKKKSIAWVFFPTLPLCFHIQGE